MAVPPVQHKQRQGSSNHQVISDMLDRGINPASVALLCCQVYPSCGPCKRLKVPVPKFGRPRAGGGAPDAADIVVELGSPKFCIIADREHAYA